MVDGDYYDKVIMDILRNEFYERNESLIRDRYLTGLEEIGDEKS